MYVKMENDKHVYTDGLKFWGCEISKYGRDNGRLDYYTMIKALTYDNYILNNSIINVVDDFELFNGADYDEETGEVISIPTFSTPEAEPMKVYTCDYKVGNTVKIVVGAFEGEVGEVKSIDLEKGKAIIQIEIFGRVTSVEVNIGDVKVNEE